MNTTIIALLTVIVLILVVLLTWLIWRNLRQNDELKEKNEVIVREVRRRSILEGQATMQTAIFALFGIWMFSACSVQDDPVTEDDVTITESTGDDFEPTQLINYPIFVAPSVDANVQHAFTWAAKNVKTEFTKNERLALLVMNKLTDIDEELLKNAYHKGTTVLLMQPVEGEIKAYQQTHEWLEIDAVKTDNTWILGFSNNSKVLIDQLETTGDPVVDNMDLDKNTYITLSGLLMSINEQHRKTISILSSSDDVDNRMENVFSSYHFIHVNQYKAHVHYDTTWGEKYYLDGNGAATTTLDVTPIHVYENQAGSGDYFAVKMYTSVANAGMWRGKGWNRRIGIYIRYCGFWCTDFETIVEPMKDEKTPMPIADLQFLASCPPTPATTNNQKYYEDTKEFSLNVTATGKAEMEAEIGGEGGGGDATQTMGLELEVALGWTWTHTESYIINNVEIEDRHSGNCLNWNIKFNDLPHYDWGEDYGFMITPSLPYRNTQGLSASWMWYAPKAKDETDSDPLLIKVTTCPHYEMQRFWTTKVDLISKYYSSKKSDFFRIPRPNNKHAGELTLVNDLKDGQYIHDIRVYRKGTDELAGYYQQTVKNGAEKSLGWYLSKNQAYYVTFKVKQGNGKEATYKYSLNDGIQPIHNDNIILYAGNDFTLVED